MREHTARKGSMPDTEVYIELIFDCRQQGDERKFSRLDVRIITATMHVDIPTENGEIHLGFPTNTCITCHPCVTDTCVTCHPCVTDTCATCPPCNVPTHGC